MEIKFKNFNPLRISFNNNPTVDTWRELFIEKVSEQFPLFRDVKKYTVEYLNSVYTILAKEVGWERRNLKTLEDFNNAHRDMEILLEEGFENIPESLDELIHDFHYGLHVNEEEHRVSDRKNLQIEWFSNESRPLSKSFEFKKDIEFGDVTLQYPYVGYSPIMMYITDNFCNATTSCQFHNIIKPGLNISLGKSLPKINYDHYKQELANKAPKFVEEHGINTILHYTGFPVIGKVENIDILEEITITNEILELEDIVVG